jgi:hypothetical protein
MQTCNTPAENATAHATPTVNAEPFKALARGVLARNDARNERSRSNTRANRPLQRPRSAVAVRYTKTTRAWCWQVSLSRLSGSMEGDSSHPEATRAEVAALYPGANIEPIAGRNPERDNHRKRGTATA